MAKTRHTNRMTAKIWTPTMTSEVEGTPDSVIPMAFCALSTKARRVQVLAELHKIDDRMTLRELASAT